MTNHTPVQSELHTHISAILARETSVLDPDDADSLAQVLVTDLPAVYKSAPELLDALLECITEDGAHACVSGDFLSAKQRLMFISDIARAAISKATTPE